MDGCHICQRTDVALFRMNPKGEAGVWGCEKHIGRVGCAVIGCRRTCGGRYDHIWICGEHWRLVPRRMKLPYFRIRKLARAQRRWTDELWLRHRRIIRRLAREATHRAYGID